ncbi:MAG: hypothetical protein REI78_15810 [Pedobacter sp.]|nr:hypothetical protein [Pedobacter sp.]MDQ8054496.1 hypothetical protein [Pedobacter sp.]
MKLTLFNKVGSYAVLISAIFLIQSCAKDDPQPEARFEIAFNAQTIGFDKVDSVTASFSRAGQAPNFTRKLTRGVGSNQYYINESDLKEGAWDATINVYTTEDQGSRRKYQLKKKYAALATTTVGPVIKSTDEWTPYIILYNAPNKVEFVMPERQDQSTFELTVPTDKPWNYLYVERSSYDQTGQLAEGKEWKVSAEVKGKINNSTAFFDYTESLKAKKWKSTEVLINLKNIGTGEECFLYYTYINRYTTAN